MDKFKDSLTKDIFDGNCGKGMDGDVAKTAKIKLFRVMSARNLKDLSMPPSNHLEKLKGNRKEQYSIRVNDRYRICFGWKDNRAFNIEFADYHK
jgi:proteic killer suppression protein